MPRNIVGFSVRIFIPSGEPEGLCIVEKSNWTGQGVVFPRSVIAEARKRPELARTVVCALWSNDIDFNAGWRKGSLSTDDLKRVATRWRYQRGGVDVPVAVGSAIQEQVSAGGEAGR